MRQLREIVFRTSLAYSNVLRDGRSVQEAEIVRAQTLALTLRDMGVSDG